MKNFFIFGDSTTCEYGEECYPQQGWAYYLHELMDDKIHIVNVAHGGFSLKTFLYSEDYRNGVVNENQPEKSEWNRILSMVKPGDYFLFYWAAVNDMGQISNDEYRPSVGGEFLRDDFFTDRDVFMKVGKGYGTHDFFTLRTTPDETRSLLIGMVNQVKNLGAIPLVAKGTGKYYKLNGNDKNVFSASHHFSDVVEDVAKITASRYFNVGGEFEEGFAELGYRKMIDTYFMSRHASEKFMGEIGKNATKVVTDDNAHYNVDGARRVCKIFLRKLKRTDIDLKEHIVSSLE